MTIILSLLALLIGAALVWFLWPAKRQAEYVTLWYAVDGYGMAYLFTRRPQRDTTLLVWTVKDVYEPYLKADDLKGILPPLTWTDGPVEVHMSFVRHPELSKSRRRHEPD